MAAAFPYLIGNRDENVIPMLEGSKPWPLASTKEEKEMNGQDIEWSNMSMPIFPDKMPVWQRILCLLGYHKRETRQTAPGHRRCMA